MKMSESIAVVTGGSSGLGEATVTRIVEEGGKAVILDLSEESGKAIEQRLGPDKVLFVKTDVSNEEQVRSALNQAVEKFAKINTVINCAGIGSAEKVMGKNGVHSLDNFSKIMQVNLIGGFNVIRLAVEKMVNNEPNEEGERGVIVSTASVAAFEGQIGQVAYSASKGGVVAMTLPLARELSNYGIRVLTIAPGLVHTPLFDALPEKARESLASMVPFPKRLGKPSEYSYLVKSMIENPLLNGETIRLDGAVRMQPR